MVRIAREAWIFKQLQGTEVAGLVRDVYIFKDCDSRLLGRFRQATITHTLGLVVFSSRHSFQSCGKGAKEVCRFSALQLSRS